MKKLSIALIITIWSLISFQVAHAAEPEKKRVCRVDEKTKKEVCKLIKVHKKLEGTPVPEKAQKK
jgi:hypothetical protein